jgi:TatD DNase family protein
VALIAELKEKEIGVINVSSSPESIEAVIKLASENEQIWGLLGIHPTDLRPEILTSLPEMLVNWQAIIAKNPKIVGIGEVGLDYHHEKLPSSANRQKAALREFLTFAKENDLPMSIHCRDAYGDLLTILADYPGVRAVIHCYNGSAEQARAFLDLGCLLSFTAILTYPGNETLRTIIQNTPLNKIMLETDAPFLPVQSHRGERNDPGILPELSAFVADLKGVTVDEVAQVTTATANNFFKLAGGA